MTKAGTDTRRRWLTAVSTLLAALLLLALLRMVDWLSVERSVRNVPAWVWVCSALGMVASHWLRAGRMRTEWSGKIHMSWPGAWGLLVRHSAWVVLAPMRSGEAVYVWALHKQGGVPVWDATASLAKLRLQDASVLLSLGCLLLLPLPWSLRVPLALAVLAMAAWATPWLWQRAMLRKKQLASPHARPPQQGQKWVSWMYAIANWPVKLAALALPLAHVAPLGPSFAMCGVLGGEFGAALPLQPPAGLGPYEAAVWAGVQLCTAGADVSTQSLSNLPAAALVVHLLAILVTVASATVAWALGWSSQRFPPLGTEQP